MKNESLFSTWFESQFGKRPVFPYDLNFKKKGHKMDREFLHEFIIIGEDAKEILQKQRIWDQQHHSALSAWMARDLSTDEILKRIG